MIYFHSLFDDCPVRRAVVFCVIDMRKMYGAITCVAGYRSKTEEQNQKCVKFDMKYII